MQSLSVVLPAFNEAPNIWQSVAAGRQVLDGLGLDWEIVAVDDGSTDHTWAILKDMQALDGRVLPVRHGRNLGYGAALQTGFRAASRDLVFFTDADLQFDMAELPRLIALASRYDIVAGFRSPRRDPMVRRLNGWAWGRLVQALFNVPVRDVNCAFKLFHRRVLDQILVRSGGAFVNTEILVRARAAGFRLTEVAVSHHPRQAGSQTGARPAVVLRALAELVSLYGELRAETLRAPGDVVSDAPVSCSGRPTTSFGRAHSLASTTR
ncbi:MAG: glycosyltransferase family 2 protein [Oligoflexia bacterium]|nr:glycosyltransferase family 2 protein [Oligoflexia bacterium]